MNDKERAEGYVGIFVGVGDRWRGYVPVDGKVGPGEQVRIGSVVLKRHDDGRWSLDDGTVVTWYRLLREVAS